MCGGCSAKTIEALSLAKAAVAPTLEVPETYMVSQATLDKNGLKILREDKELKIELITLGEHDMVKITLRPKGRARNEKLAYVQYVINTHMPDQIYADEYNKQSLREMYRGLTRPN